MRRKNEGRWRWLLLKGNAEWHPKYRVIKTGRSKDEQRMYWGWSLLGAFDTPTEARAMLKLLED